MPKIHQSCKKNNKRPPYRLCSTPVKPNKLWNFFYNMENSVVKWPLFWPKSSKMAIFSPPLFHPCYFSGEKSEKNHRLSEKSIEIWQKGWLCYKKKWNFSTIFEKKYNFFCTFFDSPLLEKSSFLYFFQKKYIFPEKKYIFLAIFGHFLFGFYFWSTKMIVKSRFFCTFWDILLTF